MKWLKKKIADVKWSVSDEAIEFRRHAHRMILISSMGGVRIEPNENGMMQIGHIKVSDEKGLSRTESTEIHRGKI